MIVPFFLDTPEGALHVSLHMPPDARPASGWVVHVPAFAEEMNKSRAMVSRQARALAARGYAVVVPDLYGTGDSAGELREATWALWQRNVEAVLDCREALAGNVKPKFAIDAMVATVGQALRSPGVD